MNTSSVRHVSGMWIDLFSRPGFTGRHTRLVGPAHFEDLPGTIGSLVVGQACELFVVTHAGTSLRIDGGARIEDLQSVLGDGVAQLDVSTPPGLMRQAA